MRCLTSGLFGRRALALLASFLFVGSGIALAQSGTVSGLVTDLSDGQPLIGANVLIISSGGSQLTGAATGADGRYSISNIPAGTYTVRARFLGYQEAEVPMTLSAGGSQVIDFEMTEEGFELNTVVITGSRREEKVLDAPSSISVLTAEDLRGDVGMSSVEALRTTTGVDMAQTGVDRREVVLRGFNNAFSGAAYVLTDYRQAAVASLAVNIYSIMPNINIDVDRVEVVRGPGSALYGAGVDSGVIHFITKSPFTHPGTTVSVSGGERSYFGAQFRHAGVVPGGRLGYKVTGSYGSADDWELDPSNPTDSLQLYIEDANGNPVIQNRDNSYSKFSVNGSLEYRVTDKATLTANFGTAALKATVLSGIGTLQADGFGYSYGQLRFQAGRFFAQAYANLNDAGDSFVYGQDFDNDGTADPVVDNGIEYNFQAQYGFGLGTRQDFIVGADADLTRPDTEGTILDTSVSTDVNEVGAYVQSQTDLSNMFDLTLALRADYNNVVDDVHLSPRAALVFKPSERHSFRVTYNRAFSSPGTNSNFLNIVAGQSGPITVRGRGAGFGYTWDRNAAYAGLVGSDLVATSLNPATLGQPQPVGLPLSDVYASVMGGLNALYAANPEALAAQVGGAIGLPPGALDVNTLGFLIQQLGATEVGGWSAGDLVNPITLTGLDDLVDIQPLQRTTTETFEIGYKGLISDRLIGAVDLYYTTRSDFVGPLLLETPFVVMFQLQADLANAIAQGVTANETLSGALASLGQSPASVAAVVAGIAAATPGFPQPTPASPVAIVQPNENNPGPGNVPELMLTYRNFGALSYSGADVSFEFLASDQLSILGNASITSDDFFGPAELDEEGTDLSLALNASTFKGRLGFKYASNSGFRVDASARYTEGFPVQSGPYVGGLPSPFNTPGNPYDIGVESFFLVDLGFGYDFGASVPGLTLDLGINNALDNQHREFIGAPQLGRMGIARLTYSM